MTRKGTIFKFIIVAFEIFILKSSIIIKSSGFEMSTKNEFHIASAVFLENLSTKVLFLHYQLSSKIDGYMIDYK